VLRAEVTVAKTTITDDRLCFGSAFLWCVSLVIAGWFAGRHDDDDDEMR
jgi:hypothetical protein